MDRYEVLKKADAIRRKLNIDSDMPLDLDILFDLVPDLTLIYYPMGDRISGICIKEELPVIAINSSMSQGRQLFSFAHELYHLYFDEEHKISTSSISIGEGNYKEKCADQFASHLLIPVSGLQKQLEKLNVTEKINDISDVVHLEQYFNVSRKAMLTRLYEEKLITNSEKEDFAVNVRSSARKLGYSDELYTAAPEDKAHRTYGEYIKRANELYDNDKISTGMFEEFLMAAFRDDLVYGEEDELDD